MTDRTRGGRVVTALVSLASFAVLGVAVPALSGIPREPSLAVAGVFALTVLADGALSDADA